MIKTGLRVLSALAVAAVLGVPYANVYAAQQNEALEIIYTNDVHNAYLQTSADDGSITSLGYAAVAHYKKAAEASGNAVELADAGDAIQGDVIGTLSKGEYITDIMDKVGYTLAVPGNHEFDYGMEQFLNLAENKGYGFKYLSCNFIDLKTDKTVFEPYEIKAYNLNGKEVSVAYIGITTPDTITKSTPKYFWDDDGNYIYGFCEDDSGEKLYNCVQSTIDAAKADGADYIVAIGHLGIDPSSIPWTSKEVIANTHGIDAFIDGHSHSTIEGEKCKDKNGSEVLLTSTGYKLAAFGSLTLTADGKLESKLITNYTLQDDETLSYINDVTKRFDDLQNTVVARAEIDLLVNDPKTGERRIRSGETNMGDLCADAYRQVLGTDIAFVNGGGIRDNILTGDITYGDIIRVHPFGNMLCSVEATGSQIRDALEFGVRYVGLGESGSFLHCSGLTYEVNSQIPSGVVTDDQGCFVRVDGEYRVHDIKVDGEPLDLNKTYTVGSHNYMLKNGGSGFNMFLDDKLLLDEVMIDYQALIDYITDTLGGTIAADGEYANPYGNARIIIDGEIPTAEYDGGYKGISYIFERLSKIVA